MQVKPYSWLCVPAQTKYVKMEQESFLPGKICGVEWSLQSKNQPAKDFFQSKRKDQKSKIMITSGGGEIVAFIIIMRVS